MDGALYSTTEFGGASSNGTCIDWRRRPRPAERGPKPRSSALPEAPTAPAVRALAAGRKGALYGTTLFGGESGYGTVFQLIPPATGGLWTETVLHSFSGENGDGASPLAGVVLGANGVLYGVTLGGGSRHGGTVSS